MSFCKGGELSEPGSVDELSTGHFNMPYDMVREGKECMISVNFLGSKSFRSFSGSAINTSRQLQKRERTGKEYGCFLFV